MSRPGYPTRPCRPLVLYSSRGRRSRARRSRHGFAWAYLVVIALIALPAALSSKAGLRAAGPEPTPQVIVARDGAANPTPGLTYMDADASTPLEDMTGAGVTSNPSAVDPPAPREVQMRHERSRAGAKHAVRRSVRPRQAMSPESATRDPAITGRVAPPPEPKSCRLMMAPR